MNDNTLRIAVMPGDGIGVEVMDAALAVMQAVEKRHALGFRCETIPGGALHRALRGRVQEGGRR
jgi:3-isopropylmalate dehydrogenase